MNLYFDTEFTGLHKNTTLISLGIISEDDRIFYAEFNDFDKSQIDEWLQKNIIDKLWYDGQRFEWDYPDDFYWGNTSHITIKLREWLDQFDDIQFVSDVSHYDFVLLIDLISGHALKLPDNINPYCHDINQDIAKYYNISDKEAFDKNRESIAKEFVFKKTLKNNINKHNALWDAKVIKAIYEKVSKGE